MLRTCLALLATLLLATPAFAETVENPMYTPWAKFNVGASVTRTTTMDMGTTKTKMETTETLKSKDKDKIVLTTTMVTIMTVPGQGEQRYAQPASDREIPTKIEKVAPPKVVDPTPTPQPATTKGEETLKIAGKDVACNWVAITIKATTGDTTAKTWSSTAMPGGFVKSVTATKGDHPVTSEMIVTAFKAP